MQDSTPKIGNNPQYIEFSPADEATQVNEPNSTLNHTEATSEVVRVPLQPQQIEVQTVPLNAPVSGAQVVETNAANTISGARVIGAEATTLGSAEKVGILLPKAAKIIAMAVPSFLLSYKAASWLFPKKTAPSNDTPPQTESTPPKAQEPVAPTLPKTEEPVTPTPPKAEEPIAPTPPKTEEPVTPTPPKAEEPIAPTPPKTEEPVAPTPPKTEEPVVPPKPLAQPQITFDTLAQDDVINATEAASPSIQISGRVTHAKENDIVMLRIGTEPPITAKVLANGTFSATTSGAVLAKSREITATVTTRDSYGNEASGTATKTYQVIGALPQPQITFDTLAQDNVINATEAASPSIQISGRVTHAKENDIVTLRIGTEPPITAKVLANNSFSATTSGAVLAKSREITASVTTRDSYGSEATGTATKAYDVITTIPQPTIWLYVAGDNIITTKKALGDVYISGSLTNVKEGDIVTVQLGQQSFTAVVKTREMPGIEIGGVIIRESSIDYYFEVEVSGKTLLQHREVSATVVTRDNYGNEATGTATKTYQVIGALPQPQITFDRLAQDDVINATEAASPSIQISGRVTNAKENDIVTLRIGTEPPITAKVLANNSFSATTSGAILAKTHEIIASVTTRDSYGNEATGTATKTYQVVGALPQPQITFDTLAQDNVINATEAASPSIQISGRVTHAKENDIVTLRIGTEPPITAKVLANSTFSATTSGAVLAKTHEIIASVTTRDSYGNEASSTATKTYQVIGALPQPQITFDTLAQDNVINATEAASPSIQISGRVTNAKENDIVTLRIGTEPPITAKVLANSTFSATTSGAVLAKTHEIIASVTTRDSYGNEATGTATKAYQVVGALPQPQITFDTLAQDNVINATEAASPSIQISGRVTNAKENDIVTLRIGTEILTAPVKNSAFSTTTSGAVLAKTHEIIASVTTRDGHGNEATGSTRKAYQVITTINKPEIIFDTLADDNVINGIESQRAQIAISGRVANAKENDIVTLRIGNESPITAKVLANGTFSATASGAVLAKTHEIIASVTTRDSYGNEATGSEKKTYRVITSTPKPQIIFNDITQDNAIDAREARGNVEITGRVLNARENEVVTVRVGTEVLPTHIRGGQFSVTTSGAVLAKNREISASLTTQDEYGNQNTGTGSKDYRIISSYTTTINYPNNPVELETGTPFNTATLKYTLNDPLIYLRQNSTAFRKVINALNQYVESNPELAARNLEAAYKQDSDHDGIIDIHDKNPNVWNVSERDLRFFATAAHSSRNVNEKIFIENKESNISSFNALRIGGNADIQEVSQHWNLLRYEEPGDGLKYAIYGNGRKADGSYHNVVIGFGGTQWNDRNDVLGNINIYLGQKHPQTKHLEQAAQYVMQYNADNVYSTGHSLGGYLAQFFAAYTMQQNSERAASFHHSSLFNPAVLQTRSFVSPKDLEQARYTTGNFMTSQLTDDSDLSAPVQINKTNSYVINGDWLNKWLGQYTNTTFFETPVNENLHGIDHFYKEDFEPLISLSKPAENKREVIFSKGYRMDNHYLNKDSDNDGLTNQQEAKIGTKSDTIDTDGDGFSDVLEAKLASNPLDAKAVPNFLPHINVADVFSPITVNVLSKKSPEGGGKTEGHSAHRRLRKRPSGLHSRPDLSGRTQRAFCYLM